MKIVLREDLEKVGQRGDIVEVADGYARNFLIPRGFAIAATRGITDQAARMRAARDRADAKKREAAQQQASSLEGVRLRIEARSGSEGKLFGSVTNADVVKALTSQTDLVIDRRQIELHEPIRTVGEHLIPVKLHTDVHVTLTVEVVASQS